MDERVAALRERGVTNPEEARQALRLEQNYGLKLDFNSGTWSLDTSGDQGALMVKLGRALIKERAALTPFPALRNLLATMINEQLQDVTRPLGKVAFATVLTERYTDWGDPQIHNQFCTLAAEIENFPKAVSVTPEGDVEFGNFTADVKTAIQAHASFATLHAKLKDFWGFPA